MNKLLLKRNIIAMVTFTIAIFFLNTSCKNDTEEVKEVTENLDLPLAVQYDVHYEYSDSAKKQLDITAPQVTDFSHKEEPYLEFPDGIRVTFYDSFGEKEAFLKANYAKRFVNKRMWEARGNVVVINSKNEELNSEELTWDENEESIYSDKFVKIITEENVIKGTGFEADQSFDKWKIFNPEGTIEVDEDESE